ncbi:MAG TPA: rod shape-determining protein RodA [Actinomycetes bacterium]|jgi:rod shape determining protein RodA|nr:rod shape-determining protein RodA [Actinomycetes bacterium]
MMQESWGSYRDRVSRLGWEGASERPMAWRTPWRHLDPVAAMSACALAVLGLVAIYSATVPSLRAQGLPGDLVLRRQLVSLAVGLAGMAAVTLVDHRRLQAWAVLLYAGVVAVLGLVLTPLGSASNGAQSWFSLGPYQVQPSEYAKVGLIVTLAAVFGGQHDDEVPGLRQLGLGLAATGLVCLEILLQPDFGTFMVFVAILFGVLLVAGVKLRWLLVLVLVGCVGVVGMFKLDVLKEYQKERLTAFIDPSADASGRGYTYNARQALIAIGSGGVTGKGYLRGSQTNLQYVPEQKTDFIFTVIGEELGFAGSAALLALLALLAWRGLRIAAMARDRFGALLAAGVVSMLVFQAFVNLGMTIGIMPITGIPLPFVSYGGSSLISSLLAIGLLENVHMRRYL